jgi:hypothetical protein
MRHTTLRIEEALDRVRMPRSGDSSPSSAVQWIKGLALAFVECGGMRTETVT